MSIALEVYSGELQALFQDIANSKMKWILRGMVNDLAFRTMQAVYDEMDIKLEPPLKRYTLTSMRVDKATGITDLSARVYLSDYMNQDRVLGHLFKGGDRRYKLMEGALLRAGIMPAGRYAVPGQGCPLDQYGNIPASFVRRILSYFGTLNEGNMLPATRAKLARKKKIGGYSTIQGVEYFIAFAPGTAGYDPNAKKKMYPGIYSRTGIHGVDVKPIIMFVPKRKGYQRYINLPELGRAVIASHASRLFAENLAYQLATAKRTQQFMGALDG